MDRKGLKSKLVTALVAAAIPVALGAGCVDPDTFLPPDQAGSPAGVLDGIVTYAGPLPCTEDDHIVGAALMLLFEENLLPPPEGLGTTAASLAVVGGDTLFGGLRGRLTFNPDGSRWCPDPGTPPVTVGAPWAAAPLAAGVYEVRGFYDYDGNFDPAFSIFTLPTKGDVGGGAIENAAEVLLGGAPKYRRIALGELVNEATGERRIPERGARIGGIAVTLALPLPLERPIFYPKTVYDEVLGNTDPNNVVLPADYQLPVFAPGDPAGTEQSLIRYGMAGGVKPEEIDIATAPPFELAVKSPSFFYQWQDVNGDGILSIGDDHVPDSPIIPSLLPVTIFSKLIEEGKPGATGYTPQSAPVVIMQGLTIYKDLLSTALAPTSLQDFTDELIIGLRPAVLCLDPLDRSKGAVLLVTYPTDKMGNTILTAPLATKTALQKQFNREIFIEFGCLPEGKYAMNAVYGTGQAWSVPNEAGICGPSEIPTNTGCKCGENGECGSRPIIPSQSPVLTIGPPDDPTYCETQANLPEYKHKTLCFPQ